jgi:hypothetical protein
MTSAVNILRFEALRSRARVRCDRALLRCSTIAALRPGGRAIHVPAVVSLTDKPREFFIQGITRDGRTFRPSDWAERLAGTMSCFRPAGSMGGIGSAISYSPYCIPTVIDGVKCVVVNEALRGVEPMAWDFVMNFARDNELRVVEACLLPDAENPK